MKTVSAQSLVDDRIAHLEHELELTRKQLRTLEAKVETGTMLPPYWPFGSALDRALFFGYLSSTAMVLLGFALGFGWI